jgi:NADPH:quinone reductase-like Zn-dependent oxidoreductase
MIQQITSIQELYQLTGCENELYFIVESGMIDLFQWLDEGKLEHVFETIPLEDAKAANEKLQKGMVRGKLLLIRE